jgi:hypothetical protein
MIFHIPMRYELFMKAKNNELFILDKLTKYIETINNDLRPWNLRWILCMSIKCW